MFIRRSFLQLFLFKTLGDLKDLTKHNIHRLSPISNNISTTGPFGNLARQGEQAPEFQVQIDIQATFVR